MLGSHAAFTASAGDAKTAMKDLLSLGSSPYCKCAHTSRQTRHTDEQCCLPTAAQHDVADLKHAPHMLRHACAW